MNRHAILAIVAIGAATSALPARAAVLSAENGMTVYVFDKDAGGASACYADCASMWPPYVAKGGAKKGEGWATSKRKDGAAQWTYDGKPLYFYSGDKKKGEVKGDGIGGVWHVVNE